MSSLVVVMPTYLEAPNLRRLIPELEDVFSSSGLEGRILVVDDSSPDDTSSLVEDLEREYGNVHLLLRPEKKGLGSAYRDGFNYVLEKFNVDYVVEMDADGSHPPHLIPLMVEALEKTGADVVVASRKVAGGGSEGWPRSRRIISWGGNILARVLTGIDTRDSTSGYRVYRSSALHEIDFSSAQSGYAFQVEMLFKCKRAGLNVIEVPFTFAERRHGKSKMGKRQILGFAWALIKMMFRRLR